MWDIEHDTIHWSDEVYRIVGREPGSIQPSPRTWAEIVHAEDAEAVAKATAMVTNGGVDYHAQYRVIWLESQGKGQRDGAGRVMRVVGVISDATHRKQAEEAMLRAEKLAVAGRLAASVAHEINNPLEAVANLLYLVTIADANETARAYARQALDELMRVSLVTQQTLKFHRQTGVPKIIKLSEIVETVLALFRRKLQAAHITVDVRAEREEGVACMPSETQQIFANLMSNAIDAMPRGGRLVIRLRPSYDWRDRKTAGMRVTFCDSGVGMERKTMRRIFDPFFTTKAETGTGLGMWVVAQLLERRHGHVRVWSTRGAAGSGTAFSLFLPFEDTSETDDVPVVSPASAGLQMEPVLELEAQV